MLLAGDGNDLVSDADGALSAPGGGGNNLIDLTFAPDWNVNGSPVLLSFAISGGSGDDTLWVTTNNSAMQFDIFGDAGNDRLELYGEWNRMRMCGGAGNDSSQNRATGLVGLNNVKILP